MLRLTVTLHVLALTILGRTHQRLTQLKTDRERGSVTLEQVIITAALVLLAIGVGTAITVAVSRRLVGIR